MRPVHALIALGNILIGNGDGWWKATTPSCDNLRTLHLAEAWRLIDAYTANGPRRAERCTPLAQGGTHSLDYPNISPAL